MYDLAFDHDPDVLKLVSIKEPIKDSIPLSISLVNVTNFLMKIFFFVQFSSISLSTLLLSNNEIFFGIDIPICIKWFAIGTLYTGTFRKLL